MTRFLLFSMSLFLHVHSWARTASEITLFSHSSEHAGVEIVNWYYVFLAKVISLFLPDAPAELVLHKAQTWSPVCASIFALVLLVIVAKLSGFSKMEPSKMSDEELLPPSKFGFRAFIELAWNVVQSTLESVVGEHGWRRFVTMLGGTFFILLISNLSGVFPGFTPATSSMSFTFAASVPIFFYFNYYGFKEAGFNYVKHFAGPVLFIAPFMFVIELVQVFARPVSLSLRIFGNVSGDHFVFDIFSDLMKKMSVPFIPVPSLFLAFGAFVACIQAFIFMTLSAVYVKIALDSKESHH